MQHHGRTLITELPEEDEALGFSRPHSEPRGMDPYSQGPQQHRPQQQHPQQQHHPQQQYLSKPPIYGVELYSDDDNKQNNTAVDASSKMTSGNNCNCIEVADHVKHCNVCSRLYSSDNMIFYIIIIALICLCLLLLKKVLDKRSL